MAESHYHYALGRRKSSTARVRLQNGKGGFVINGKNVKDFFNNSKPLLHKLGQPFSVVDIDPMKYDLSVVVKGGGLTGQVEAIRLAIAKSLVIMNPDLKSTLKRADLLGRDPREKERKKPGLRSARKQRQFTKR
jgi:small subunit ribosomal protein S9